MYFIERNTITDAMFLAGSVAEPSTTETAWVAGTYAIGAEVIRTTTHRVYRCAIARAPTDTQPPEVDTNSWADMRPTDRYLPFGPQVRTDGKLLYQNIPLKSTTGNIEYRMAQRYANAVAIFGTKGATWRVQVYDAPGGTLVAEYTGRIRSAATGYWDYAYGQRTSIDRVLVTGIPIFPNAEIRVSIEGSGVQERAVSHIEIGKLRYIPGVDFMGSMGVEYGVVREPRAYTTQEIEADGTTAVLIYGTTSDLSGTIKLSGRREDVALQQLRGILGKGVVFAPILKEGYQQSLTFGILKSAPVTRDFFNLSSIRFEIEGLPT